MAEIINMPKLGFDMQEGQLVGWLKKVGDEISEGDVIAEIESDKATIEVEVFQAGTLLELLATEGDWVPVGAPIAIIGAAGEAVDKAALDLGDAAAASTNGESGSTPAPAEAPAADAKAPNGTNGTTPAVSKPADGGAGFPEGVKASPLARKVADDLGVNLGSVEGSGPNGRIIRADVERFKEEMGDMPAAPAAAPAGAPAPVQPGQIPFRPVTATDDDKVIETSRMRKAIVKNMVESKTTIPHFYVTVDIDMEPAVALRKDINARLEEQDVKVSINDMVIKAAALTLANFRNLNASFNGDSIVQYGHINVGIAVAIPGGLLNVVSKDADKTPLAKMAVSHKEMIARAREGKVKPDDVSGETFAVSNLGPYDVENFVAVINPPGAAIMAVGSAKKVPVVTEDGRVGIGTRMKATLSADHRVTDGAEAAQFMKFFKDVMEDPMRLLL